jgi:hypothetical protein
LHACSVSQIGNTTNSRSSILCFVIVRVTQFKSNGYIHKIVIWGPLAWSLVQIVPFVATLLPSWGPGFSSIIDYFTTVYEYLKLICGNVKLDFVFFSQFIHPA